VSCRDYTLCHQGDKKWKTLKDIVFFW
jgi:hypothetical protein